MGYKRLNLNLFFCSRLRDNLVEEERFDLALTVATTCGIDTSSVWAAWGMAGLKMRNWTAAREKFCRCLKVTLKINRCVLYFILHVFSL